GGHRPGQYAVSTSNPPPGIPENPVIEAQSTPWRRPALVWLALYPFAWLGLFGISGMLWYLPAGLRLGTLWLLPRRLWPAMAAVEITTLVILGQTLGYRSVANWLLGAILPWCIYALVLRGIGRHGRGTPAYKALPRLLAVGFVAAVLNSLLLTAIDLNDDGSL